MERVRLGAAPALALVLLGAAALLRWDPRAAAVAGLVLLPAALAGFAWAWMIWMPGRSHEGPPPPPTPEEIRTAEALEGHVTVLAGEIGERNFTRPEALEAAARYLEEELEALGYRVRSRPFTGAGQAFRNLEVTLEGRAAPDEIVVVGAHYDSAPGTPGANDNGSGVAALLELARRLRGAEAERTLRLVAFTNEEPPFFETSEMGSRVYAREAADAGEEIVAMLSLETIGYYSDAPGSQAYPFPLGALYPDRGDFIGFVGNLASRGLVRRSLRTFRETTPLPSQGVSAPSWLPGVGWSDHASFWRHGIAAIMITDTAPFRYPHYHGPGDVPSRVDYPRTARVVEGILAVVGKLAGVH